MSDPFFKSNSSYIFRAVVDYVFRRRLPGVWLVRGGIALLALLITGLSLDVTIPTSKGPFQFSFSNGGTPLFLTLTVLSVALVLIGLGLRLTWLHVRREDRKRVIVIELRGLRDTSGDPLRSAVPPEIVGRREQVLIDLRQGLDGRIAEPQAALRRLEALPHELANREAGVDRDDIVYVAGGLAPVPYSFLAGVLLDDEHALTLMDWNRHLQAWSLLDAPDDAERFHCLGLDQIGQSDSEVVLAVSLSYRVDVLAIAEAFPGLPVVELQLKSGNPDAHWSEQKQVALSRQFLETAIGISNAGARAIHLVLAAPNSIVIRFGRTYDKRNLPAVVVYQYERDQRPAYPWGVRMPVAGKSNPEIVCR